MISENLKEAREKQQLSRKELAKILGIHETTYGKYELGIREPDLNTLKLIADKLNTTLEFLIIDKKNSYSDYSSEQLSEAGKKAAKIVGELSPLLQREALRYLTYLEQQENSHTQEI